MEVGLRLRCGLKSECGKGWGWVRVGVKLGVRVWLGLGWLSSKNLPMVAKKKGYS